MPDSRKMAIRYGWRMRLGMLVPSGNRIAEPEVSAMLPEGVSLHVTRLKLTGSSREQLLGMTEKVEEGAALLADAGVDLIVFHCTAVSTFDPSMEDALKGRIETASGGIPATATSEALLAAFGKLAVRRIVLVSPYIKPINEREVAFLGHRGISVLREAGMGIEGPDGMAAVEPGEWYRFVRAHQDPNADAYFVSCTAIRAVSVIEALEADLGKPVVTSNQAMVWHCLRKGGIADRLEGYGRLFSH